MELSKGPGLCTGYAQQGACLLSALLPFTTAHAYQRQHCHAMGFQASALTAKQVEERLGPASQSLDALLAEGQAGSFDLAFIGAIRCRAILRMGVWKSSCMGASLRISTIS